MSTGTDAAVGRSPSSGVPAGTPVREPSATPSVTVRFWAGARAAAGVETTTVAAASVGELRRTLEGWRPALGPVLEVSSIVVDGLTATDDALALDTGNAVEILPPFAGG